MQFVTDKKQLNTTLEWVKRAVPEKPNHPILGNVLIQQIDREVKLIGFDLSMGINGAMRVRIASDCKDSITLPVKLLSEIVKKLPDGEVTIEADDTATAILTSSSGKYTIRGLAPEEYPKLPEIEGDNFLELPVETLLNGAKCLSFASGDETKQVLTGIHLKVTKDKIEFATTNGHCLMVVTINEEEPEKTEDQIRREKAISNFAGIELEEPSEFAITIPARAFQEVERMINLYKSEEYPTVILRYSKEQVIFSMGEQRVLCRALEGAYPKYPELLPKTFENIVTVDRRSFLGCLERVAIVAAQKNDIIVCNIDHTNQQLTISAEAADVGKATESLPAQISAEDPNKLALNVKYLIQGLKEMNTTEISLQLNTEISPVLAVPLGGVKMTFLLMPVQLRE